MSYADAQRIKELEARVSALEAVVEELRVAFPAKRGPGRPPKVPNG